MSHKVFRTRDGVNFVLSDNADGFKGFGYKSKTNAANTYKKVANVQFENHMNTEVIKLPWVLLQNQKNQRMTVVIDSATLTQYSSEEVSGWYTEMEWLKSKGYVVDTYVAYAAILNWKCKVNSSSANKLSAMLKSLADHPYLLGCVLRMKKLLRSSDINYAGLGKLFEFVSLPCNHSTLLSYSEHEEPLTIREYKDVVIELPKRMDVDLRNTENNHMNKIDSSDLVPELTPEEMQQAKAELAAAAASSKKEEFELPTASDYPLADNVAQHGLFAHSEEESFHEEIGTVDIPFFIDMKTIPDPVAQKFNPDLVPELTPEEMQQAKAELAAVAASSKKEEFELPTAPDYPLADNVAQHGLFAHSEEESFHEEIGTVDIPFFIDMKTIPDPVAQKFNPTDRATSVGLSKSVHSIEMYSAKIEELLELIIEEEKKGLPFFHLKTKMLYGISSIIEEEVKRRMETD